MLAIIAILLCFIWGHSMTNAEVSGAESEMMLNVFAPFLELFLGKGSVTDHLIRKTAHFTEFAALGFFIAWFSLLCGRKRVKDMYNCLLNAIAVAVMDESIQLLTPGRAGLVKDVLLDVSGAAFGILVLCLMAYIFKSTGKRQNGNEREK